jgi:DGQHR domain-containing protein
VDIWDNDFVKYYSTLETAIGEYAKYQLLGEMSVSPSVATTDSIPTFSVSIDGNKEMFLFYASHDLLLKYAFVSRRERRGETSYQRMVKTARLNDIKEYINKGKVFPNSIVIALEKDCWDFHKDVSSEKNLDAPKWLGVGKLKLKHTYRSCWIIDGQHRLYSYAKASRTGYLPVTAFGTLPQTEQADYFLDINLEAKKVDANLLWDLRGSIAETSARGIISNTVKDLRSTKKGLFLNNIKIPSKGEGKFSMSNICRAIENNKLVEDTWPHGNKMIKNPFWNSNHNVLKRNLVLGLNEFFKEFDTRIDASKKQQIYTDGLIDVLIGLQKLCAAFYGRRPTSNDIIAVAAPVADWINGYRKEDINVLRKTLTSEAGKNDFRDLLVKRIREDLAAFAPGLAEGKSLAEKIKDLEYSLNEFVDRILTVKIGPSWIDDKDCFNDLSDLKRIKAQAKLDKIPEWAEINFLTTVNNVILASKPWGVVFKDMLVSRAYFSDKNQIVVFAKTLWDYRTNAIGHAKGTPILYPKHQLEIFTHIYGIFTSLIEDN